RNNEAAGFGLLFFLLPRSWPSILFIIFLFIFVFVLLVLIFVLDLVLFFFDFIIEVFFVFILNRAASFRRRWNFRLFDIIEGVLKFLFCRWLSRRSSASWTGGAHGWIRRGLGSFRLNRGLPASGQLRL